MSESNSLKNPTQDKQQYKVCVRQAFSKLVLSELKLKVSKFLKYISFFWCNHFLKAKAEISKKFLLIFGEIWRQPNLFLRFTDLITILNFIPQFFFFSIWYFHRLLLCGIQCLWRRKQLYPWQYFVGHLIAFSKS